MDYVESRWRFKFSDAQFYPEKAGVRHGDVLGIDPNGRLFVGAEQEVALPTANGDPLRHLALHKGEELDWGATGLRLWLNFIESAVSAYGGTTEQFAAREILSGMQGLADKLDEQLQQLACPGRVASILCDPDILKLDVPPGMSASDILGSETTETSPG